MKQFQGLKGMAIHYGDRAGVTRHLKANGSGLVIAETTEDEEHLTNLGLKPARSAAPRKAVAKKSSPGRTKPAAPAPQPELPADKEA